MRIAQQARHAGDDVLRVGDAPGVGHGRVVARGKRLVAYSGRAVRVEGDVLARAHGRPARGELVRAQRGQRAAQRVARHAHLPLAASIILGDVVQQAEHLRLHAVVCGEEAVVHLHLVGGRHRAQHLERERQPVAVARALRVEGRRHQVQVCGKVLPLDLLRASESHHRLPGLGVAVQPHLCVCALIGHIGHGRPAVARLPPGHARQHLPRVAGWPLGRCGWLAIKPHCFQHRVFERPYVGQGEAAACGSRRRPNLRDHAAAGRRGGGAALRRHLSTVRGHGVKQVV
mmetsp:Transcript_25162/g.63852  ORF Transcript_25162/g.63852 Transcript_25162/m.63852 type:complete len:287 (+) Transcript_25162:819-1679(+)